MDFHQTETSKLCQLLKNYTWSWIPAPTGLSTKQTLQWYASIPCPDSIYYDSPEDIETCLAIKAELLGRLKFKIDSQNSPCDHS